MPRDGGDVGSVVPPIIAFSDLLKMFFFVVCMEFFLFQVAGFSWVFVSEHRVLRTISISFDVFFLDVGNLIRFQLEDG